MTKAEFTDNTQTFSGFEKYQKDAALGVLFTKFATKNTESDQRKYFEMSKEISNDYKLLLFSDQVQDTKAFDYRCAVFICEEEKKVVFANAGTRFKINSKGLSDFRDDINLVRNLEPKKLQSARELNQIVLDSLGSEAQNYTFCYTGHSLGAAIAQMASVDMELRCRDKNIEPKITSTTFDNPGSKPIIDKMMQKASSEGFQSKIDHVVINAKENFINTYNPQVGKVFEDAREIEEDQSKQSYLNQLTSKIGNYIGQIARKLTPSFIINICKWTSEKNYRPLTQEKKQEIFKQKKQKRSFSKQIEEHRLGNFIDMIIHNHGAVKEKSISPPNIRCIKKPSLKIGV